MPMFRADVGAATAQHRACTKSTARLSASSVSAPSARRWRGWRAPSACGCSIIVRMTEDAEDALGVRFRMMGELLAISDIVTLHVPLNTTTRHMIGAHELSSMKPEAIIVNTSRGPVIDEAALARALADNKLFGAGLDVFDQEPPPPDNPL